MRLTTLLDTLTEAGSGPWPPLTGTSTDLGAIGAPRAGGDLLTLGTETEFDQLVSTLIPCRANDAELWFAERTEEVELAKALCAGCPVREGCLAGAVARQEPWGVWGGEVFVDGAVVARKRGRGRPRKQAAA